MGVEIERKFLVRSDAWRQAADAGTVMKQGYFVTAPGTTVRVRIAGKHAFLTIKGMGNGIARSEFEYEIPVGDAEAMLMEFCSGRLVEKIRYIVRHDDNEWEVDDFTGDNIGLVMAELELETEEQRFSCPEWLGEEVSGDPAYGNGSLAIRPYGSW